MKVSPPDLDAARRASLAGLRGAHAAAPSARTALALARGAWLCGEYAEALPRFIEARDRDPDDAATHLALLRAASSLDRGDVEADAMAQALARHPQAPELVLHAALRLVPADLHAAVERLAGCRGDAACTVYASALRHILDHRPPAPLHTGHPTIDARWQGFGWAFAHVRGPAVWHGLPMGVLRAALAAAPAEGLTLEFGVYFGRSLGLLAAGTRGEVHGFDSFQGLPEAWNPNEPAGSYSTAGRLPQVPGNARLHPGWFDDTAPAFFRAHPGPIRLLHVDCDLYSSTRTVLDAAAGRLVPGSVLLFDDFLGYPGYEQHELKAFQELAARERLGWELIGATLLDRVVAIRVTSR